MYTIKYANRISAYIMGLDDKKYLAQTYIWQGIVIRYFKFKSIKDIEVNVLQDAIKYRVEATTDKNEMRGVILK